jgi:hypothetical protein
MPPTKYVAGQLQGQRRLSIPERLLTKVARRKWVRTKALTLEITSVSLSFIFRHPRLPVMVWIHGGAFSFGSGNAFMYGPDFFMTEKVILVTFNYRMGPLGFLSIGGDGTGNAGLKVTLNTICIDFFYIYSLLSI